jgi:hypothetical protein
MDWNSAIERSRERLVAVLTQLFEEIGLTRDGVVERVERPVHRRVQRVLLSAESALRRLIIAVAHEMVVAPLAKRPAPVERTISSQIESKSEGGDHAKPKRRRRLYFKLFDTPRRKDWGIPRGRKNRHRSEPRIHFFGHDPRIPSFLRPQAPGPAPLPEKVRAVDDGTVSALRLCRRLLAAMDALDDLVRQAQRFLRWERKPIEKRRPQRASPFRVGWPPGWRIKATHEVDDILKDCNWLVRSIPKPDTS